MSHGAMRRAALPALCLSPPYWAVTLLEDIPPSAFSCACCSDSPSHSVPCTAALAMSAMLRAASNAGETKCAAALATWLEMADPADIEDGINSFIPADQPLRDGVLDSLVKVDYQTAAARGITWVTTCELVAIRGFARASNPCSAPLNRFSTSGSPLGPRRSSDSRWGPMMMRQTS